MTRKLRVSSAHVEQFGFPSERIVARPRLRASIVHSWKPGSIRYATGVNSTAFVLTLGSLQRQRFESRSFIVAPLASRNVLPVLLCVIGGGVADDAATATMHATDSAATNGEMRAMPALYPIGQIKRQ